MFRTRLLPALLLLATTTGGPDVARAQGERAEGPTPPRLATMDGEVSFWRPGADDWAPAQINTALAAGDRLYAGPGGRVGLELASRAWVRADADTEIALASLETGYLQFELTSGRAAVDLQRLPAGQRIEVDTPNGAVLIDRPGYYRLDVKDDTTLIVRRGGEASVLPAGADTETPVRDGQQIVLTGTDTATVASLPAPAPDAFDQGNERVVAARSVPARSAQYVPPDVAGADDLDAHGDWRATADYGQVWVPRDVGADWAPYTTGRWTYDPYYSWTWVDDASWGWAPYHYGRWVYANDYWGWAPGPLVAQPIYSPALVGFVDAPGINVSLSIGVPFVSWVALGYGEPCLPWWGPYGFRSRPWWGGWGGRRWVNDRYIDNRHYGRNIDRYRNFDARGGVVGMRRDRFGRGRDNFRFRRDDLGRLRAARGAPDVRPVSASLVARDGRGRRPPDRIRNRTVVGTRAPQDPSRRLQRAGLRAPRERQQVRVQQARRDRQPGDRGPGRNRFATSPPPLNVDRRARRQERNEPDGRNAPPTGSQQNDRRADRMREQTDRRADRMREQTDRRTDRLRERDERRASRGTPDAPPPPRAQRQQERREQRQEQRLQRQDRQQQRQANRGEPQDERRQRLQTTPPPLGDRRQQQRAERQQQRVERQQLPRAERTQQRRAERQQAQHFDRRPAPRAESSRQPQPRYEARPQRQQPRFEARQQRQQPRFEARQQRQAQRFEARQAPPSRATSVRPDHRPSGGGGFGRGDGGGRSAQRQPQGRGGGGGGGRQREG